MKRAAIVLVSCLLAGCGGSESDTPDAALPVVAPMQARERLLHDVAKQNDKARERAATIEAINDRDR